MRKTVWMKLAFIDLRQFDVEPIANVNRTTDAVEGNNLSPEMKTYYEKRLLNLAEPKQIHDQFADKYPIPKNGGKSIEFRKYSPLPKAMTPITEGVTPTGNRLNVSTITATINQYGDWIGVSDVLTVTAYDNQIAQATKILASQAGRTLDSVTRETIVGGSNKRLAPHSNGNAVDLREDLTADCKLTPDLVFKASADLAAMDADYPEGSDCYVAIIHPYVAYDLMRNSEWIDVHKYTSAENIFKGEVGKLGNVRFISNSQAKIFAPEVIADKLSRLTVKTAISESTTSVDVDQEIASVTFDTAVPVWINGVENTITAITKHTGYSTLTVGTAISSLSVGDIVCGKGAGKDGSAVFATLVLGAHAYAVTEPEGLGLQHIYKPLGSGDDPLNQRASCGWKAAKAVERLVETYMVRIESGSAYSPVAKAN